MLKIRNGLPTRKSLLELCESKQLCVNSPLSHDGWVQINWSGYHRDGDARAQEVAAVLLEAGFKCDFRPSMVAMGSTGSLRIYEVKK